MTVPSECNWVNSTSDLAEPSFLHTSLDWTSCCARLVRRGRGHIKSPLRQWTDVRTENNCARAAWLHQYGDCSVSLASWHRELWELSHRLGHTTGRSTQLALHSQECPRKPLRGPIKLFKSWVVTQPEASSSNRGPTTTWRRRDGERTAQVGW